MNTTPMALAIVILLAMVACNGANSSEEGAAALDGALADADDTQSIVATRTEFNPRLLRRFRPLRSSHATTERPLADARVALGRMLYYEARLSKNHDISCNSCHPLAAYGVDGEITSLGHRGQRGSRNAPTTYNVAASFTQFWDGRAEDVEAQATGPILNPIEMAAPSPAHVVRTLKSMPDYVERFAAAFPEQEDAVTFVNAGVAIAAFERGLVTPSRWDDYLNGNKEALTPAEVDGLKVFTNVGCMVCHTGELLGGSMFQKVGVVEPWPNQGDMGRFGVTHAKGDKMVFKVPTLRNAARTAPYFHDGSGATTDQAVTMMGRHQLGLELTPSEVGAIVAWLGALTGTVDQRYIAPPDLPPSSETTPAPDAG